MASGGGGDGPSARRAAPLLMFPLAVGVGLPTAWLGIAAGALAGSLAAGLPIGATCSALFALAIAREQNVSRRAALAAAIVAALSACGFFVWGIANVYG